MGELTDPPSSQLYPRVPAVVWVLGAMALLIGSMVLVLTLGGPDAPVETAGDLTYLDGVTPKGQQGGNLVASIADVVDADLTRTGTGLTITAQVAAAIPQPLDVSSLEFRWDLKPDDGTTWTVLTEVGKETQTSVYSSTGFGAGTVDDTLLGGAQVLGDKIEVRFDFRDMPDFPTDFEWSLTTTLRAFRNEPDSPRVEDRYPDEGSVGF